MAMPKTSATRLLLVLAALVALSFSTGDSCNNVRSMSIYEACDKSCSNVPTPKVQLCQSMLLAARVAPTAEVTVYAIAAADAAMKSYKSSMAIIDRLLQIPWLPPGEKTAYEFCQDRNGKALEYMTGVTNQMSICAFAYPRQELFDSTYAISSCGDYLIDYRSSPLFDANAADQNNTYVAYYLGGLIVGK
uniref:Uncharacterized protein n=1 Tax=Avena sativa TaxID=4498 RepID=A0ACD6AGB2_AVESA